MIPRSTPQNPPAPEEAEDGAIVWREVAMASLRAVVERGLRAQASVTSKYGRTVADSLLAAWWAPPGTDRNAALPIDIEAEFLKTPHHEGVYYFRVMSAPPPESPDGDAIPELAPASYYYASASASPKQKRLDGALAMETTLSRTANELSTHLAIALARALEAETEASRLRKVVSEKDDENSRQARQIHDLKLDVEAATVDAQPMFSDEVMAPLITQLGVYMNLPSGGVSQKYLTDLFNSFSVFVREIAGDPELLATLVSRQPAAWNKISAVFNTIAEASQNESRIPMSKSILKNLLGPAAKPKPSKAPASASTPSKKAART